MQYVTTLSKKVFLPFRNLAQKKQYIELITALLSIPVLVTVIILNINSLKNINNPKQTTTPKQTEKVIYTVPTVSSSPVKQATAPSPQITQTVVSTIPCNEHLGPAAIASPQENDTVTDNPVSIDISYDTGTYCAAVWSYRINGGQWSDYDDKSIAIYNPPQGQIKLEVRVKSIASGEEQTLTRDFQYTGTSSVASPVPSVNQTTQSGSASAK